MQAGSAFPYSPDIAICEFDFFSRLKDKLAGFHADDDAKLLREVQRMSTAIDRTDVTSV
jgi:hypothetical protein